MILSEWQEYLFGCFNLLKSERGSDGGGPPIFAIEHGLNDYQIEELKGAVREVAKSHPPARGHWLVWVVYAAEIGYEYAGVEYWATFSIRTPGWKDSNSAREYFRWAYSTFHEELGGAVPSGSWADSFSIISWPITHAILPIDLQKEFAHSLYRVRNRVTGTHLASPALMGELIHSDAWRGTTRFGDFAEDQILAGTIATSLLNSSDHGNGPGLLRAAVERITTDLKRSRMSGEWLTGAQKSAEINRHSKLAATNDVDGVFEHWDFSVTITFRRRDENSEWRAYVSLPRGRDISEADPELAPYFSDSFAWVEGASSERLSRGRLLFSTSDVRLDAWPKASTPIIAFEGAPESVSNRLMELGVALPNQRQWLFRCNDEREAEFIYSGRVSPGNTYLLARRSDTAQSSSPAFKVMRCDCSDITLHQLVVPEYVGENLRQDFTKNGIAFENEIRFKPAGCWPLGMNSDHLVWQRGDRVMLRVESNFSEGAGHLEFIEGQGPVKESIQIALRGAIVDLGKLPLGRYELRLRNSARSSILGLQKLKIVTPIEISHTRYSTALFILAHPRNSTMEDLWRGEVSLSVNGPKTRNANLRLRLSNFHDQVLRDHSWKVSLPMTEETWNEFFYRLRHRKEILNAFESATRCDLSVTCADAGKTDITFERVSTPIRWIVTTRNSGYSVRLEEVDHALTPKFSYASFDRPLDSAGISETFASPTPLTNGGLYTADANNSSVAIIVSPPVHSLADFGRRSTLPILPSTVDSLYVLLNRLRAWSHARPIDEGSFHRQAGVLKLLRGEIVRLFCGNEWRRIEETVENILDRREKLHALIRPQYQTSKDLVQRAYSANINAFADAEHALKDDGFRMIASRIINDPDSLPLSYEPCEAEFFLRLFRNSKYCQMVRLAHLELMPEISNAVNLT